jgi:D-methionine transport system ATP-binding protein
MRETQLELEEVSLTAGHASSYLLQQISFAVCVGDKLGIIGPVGAGKTSLLRLLNRLISPTAGKIYFEGQDISQLPVINLRQQVVLVPQEPKLLGMTGKKALSYPLILQGYSLGEIHRRLEYWCNNLSIPESWLEYNELQLSLGQRQLIAIARALIMQPKILLLDEPTSALDEGHAHLLLHKLNKLVNQKKTTIIMVNHQLEFAQNLVNRVLYLEQGKLIEDLKLDELDWEALRKRLIEAQQKIKQDWT